MKSFAAIVVPWTVVFCLTLGQQTASTLADEVEILNVTVGKPTKLSDLVYQNTASVMVSRTGVVAAFYPKPRTGPHFYRISTDRGRTWGPERSGPPELGGGHDTGTLRDGGVIIPANDPKRSTAYTRAEGWKGDSDPDPSAKVMPGWYDVLFLRFTDDLQHWQTETASIHLPHAGPQSLDIKNPSPAKGKMVQFPNGDIVAPMYGGFQGDSYSRHRAVLVRSSDQGRTWEFYSSIAYEPEDPAPELPGMYLSSCEPSITLLGGDRMLAMLRTQYSHYPGEYKPLAACWSDDLGKTWSRPVLTKPHLMNISPTLATLDNRVVVCQYGRPGFHVAFSLDDGHTWQDRVSFSHLPEPIITGQFDMIKVGPNQLVAVGSDHEGTKVWPISVKRIRVSPARVALTGRVVDDRANPIVGAVVAQSPNRYAADDWLEHETEVDVWKAAPSLVGNPQLAFRSIQESGDDPTVRTDDQGRFRFDDVKLGEYVLTVEADGYAPQQRQIKVQPESQAEDFTLKAGRLVRGRVADAEGQPVGGVCVVLNHWHCHTDPKGYFHWSVASPVAERVTLRVDKRYSGQYEVLKTTVALSRLERQPVILKDR
jgi:hypothetical protein